MLLNYVRRFCTYLVFDAPERRTEAYEERVAWITANIR